MSYHSHPIAPRGLSEQRADLAPDERAEGLAADGAAAPGSIDSAALMRGGRLLLIRHAGETYTLRLTRQNKLLLTK